MGKNSRVNKDILMQSRFNRELFGKTPPLAMIRPGSLKAKYDDCKIGEEIELDIIYVWRPNKRLPCDRNCDKCDALDC